MTPMLLGLWAFQLFNASRREIRSWGISHEYVPLLSLVSIVDLTGTNSAVLITEDDYPDAVGVLFNRPVYEELTPGIVIAIHVEGGMAFIDNLGRFSQVWTN